MPRLLALLLLIAIAPSPATAADAGAPGAKAGSGNDEPEETDVQPIAAPAKGGKPATAIAPRFELKQVFGRLHPIFVHLPIGWLTLLVLLELAALVRRRDEGGGFRLAVLALTVASCIPAVVSGLIRADEVTAQAPDAARLAGLHRNLMLAVSGASLLALSVRLGLGRKQLVGLPRLLYLAILIAAAGLLTVGAHLGGKLAFGERYLPF